MSNYIFNENCDSSCSVVNRQLVKLTFYSCENPLSHDIVSELHDTPTQSHVHISKQFFFCVHFVGLKSYVVGYLYLLHFSSKLCIKLPIITGSYVNSSLILKHEMTTTMFPIINLSSELILSQCTFYNFYVIKKYKGKAVK